jgi:hypothetical protein
LPKHLAVVLQQTIDRELPLLQALTEEQALVPGKTAPGKADGWSRKEELGHLIDSAANNHIRFVLATIDTESRTRIRPGQMGRRSRIPGASLVDAG